MNINKFLTCILVCVAVKVSHAQIDNQKIDSLIVLAKHITNVDSSDLLIDQIISESNVTNYQTGIVDGILLKAGNLHNRDRFDDALSLLQRWEKFIKDTENDVRICQLYALRANSYNSLFFTEKSRACLKIARSYAEKIVDDNTRYNNLAKVYMILSNTFEVNKNLKLNFDSILFYRKKAYQIQHKIIGGGVLKTGAVIQGSAIGSVFLKIGKIDSGIHYFQRSIQLTKQHRLEKFAFPAYVGLGDIHLMQKRLDSALVYYMFASNLALKIKNNSNIKDIYQKLSIVHGQLGNTDMSIAYLKKHSHIADSLAQTGKNAAKASSDIIIAEEEQILNNKKTYYVLTIIGSCVALIVLIYMLVRLRKRHQKSVAKYKLEQDELYQKLGKFKAEVVADKINDGALREVIALAMANDPIFLIKFKELHPVFIQKLMELSPGLATSDLSMCAQLRLGFYTKEIARYTGVSVRAVEGKKHRIRKKLNIPPSEDINVWMIKL